MHFYENKLYFESNFPHVSTIASWQVIYFLICLEDVPYNADDGPFTICDYGTADGGVSSSLKKACVGMLIIHSTPPKKVLDHLLQWEL